MQNVALMGVLEKDVKKKGEGQGFKRDRSQRFGEPNKSNKKRG